jgi:hypothetical protein
METPNAVAQFHPHKRTEETIIMVTRTTIARIEQRIEAAISHLDPAPPEPRHPGMAWCRQMMIRFGATQEEADAQLAAAAREGHEHLREHPAHPLYGRVVTEEEARATYEAARAASSAKWERWLQPKRGAPATPTQAP